MSSDLTDKFDISTESNIVTIVDASASNSWIWEEKTKEIIGGEGVRSQMQCFPFCQSLA